MSACSRGEAGWSDNGRTGWQLCRGIFISILFRQEEEGGIKYALYNEGFIRSSEQREFCNTGTEYPEWDDGEGGDRGGGTVQFSIDNWYRISNPPGHRVSGGDDQAACGRSSGSGSHQSGSWRKPLDGYGDMSGGSNALYPGRLYVGDGGPFQPALWGKCAAGAVCRETGPCHGSFRRGRTGTCGRWTVIWWKKRYGADRSGGGSAVCQRDRDWLPGSFGRNGAWTV